MKRICLFLYIGLITIAFPAYADRAEFRNFYIEGDNTYYSGLPEDIREHKGRIQSCGVAFVMSNRANDTIQGRIFDKVFIAADPKNTFWETYIDIAIGKTVDGTFTEISAENAWLFSPKRHFRKKNLVSFPFSASSPFHLQLILGGGFGIEFVPSDNSAPLKRIQTERQEKILHEYLKCFDKTKLQYWDAYKETYGHLRCITNPLHADCQLDEEGNYANFPTLQERIDAGEDIKFDDTGTLILKETTSKDIVVPTFNEEE